MSELRRVLNARRWSAVALSVGGLLVTVWLAVLGSRQDEPSTTESIGLVVVAGFCQLGAAFIARAEGRADPSLIRAAVRNLQMLAVRANQAKRIAENGQDFMAGAELKRAIGQVSVHLSYMEELALNEVENWKAVAGSDKVLDVADDVGSKQTDG